VKIPADWCIDSGRHFERPVATVKKHNIIIERWPGEIGPHGKRMPPCFRWTVTYEKDGVFQVQGYEDTHAAARTAASNTRIDRKGIASSRMAAARAAAESNTSPKWNRRAVVVSRKPSRW